jgi:hypothetical protein
MEETSPVHLVMKAGMHRGWVLTSILGTENTSFHSGLIFDLVSYFTLPLARVQQNAEDEALTCKDSQQTISREYISKH